MSYEFFCYFYRNYFLSRKFNYVLVDAKCTLQHMITTKLILYQRTSIISLQVFLGLAGSKCEVVLIRYIRSLYGNYGMENS